MSIASEITRLQTAKADIKTAIENKGVTVSASDTLDDYADYIDDIPTGGSLTESEVNFYDYDGTLLYAYTLAEAQALTALPDLPDHSDIGLDKDSQYSGWNWTLADIQALTTGCEAYIGANYDTDDTYTHIFIDIEEANTTVYCRFYYAEIDWGDDSTSTNSGTDVISHTYSSAGSYEIIISTASGSSDAAQLGYYNGTPKIGSISYMGNVTISSISYYFSSLVTEIHIGSSLGAVSQYAFSGFKSLNAVSCPSNGNCIANSYTFYSSSIKAFVICRNAAYTSVTSNSFKSCISLETVCLSKLITSISNSAFSGCSSLHNISFSGNTNCTISLSSFDSVPLKDTLSFPSGVYVGQYPFSGSRVKYLTFSTSGSFNAQPFYNMNYLKSVTLPNYLVSIAASAFYNCYSLASITIPDSVTSIGNYAFYHCTSLTSITIPENVTSIGTNVFADCSALSFITMESTTPPTLSDATIPTTALTKIYVPSGTLSDYQSATNWSTFASYMEEVTT